MAPKRLAATDSQNAACAQLSYALSLLVQKLWPKKLRLRKRLALKQPARHQGHQALGRSQSCAALDQAGGRQGGAQAHGAEAQLVAREPAARQQRLVHAHQVVVRLARARQRRAQLVRLRLLLRARTASFARGPRKMWSWRGATHTVTDYPTLPSMRGLLYRILKGFDPVLRTSSAAWVSASAVPASTAFELCHTLGVYLIRGARAR